jgi:polyisoprenoid-binding protein YceI
MKEMISDSTPTGLSNAAIAGIVQIPVLSIDSGKGKMDKKMRKLLKADDYPEIIFELTNLEVTASPETGKAQVQLKTMGNVKVAGVEKTIALEVIGNLEANGTIRFTGSKKLLMTDFNIKPPTMFFGRLKTGDEITVYFEIVLIPSIQISLN